MPITRYWSIALSSSVSNPRNTFYEAIILRDIIPCLFKVFISFLTSVFFQVSVLIGHVNAEKDLAVKTESTLEAREPPREGKVCQDMVLGSVPAFHNFLAQLALPSFTTGL